MFSSVAVPFYITPLSMRVPISPHVHQQLLFSILFVYLFVNNSHPDGYEVAFHSGFDFSLIQFSYSVMSDSVTPWTTAHQASLSITNSQSLLKLMSIETVIWSLGQDNPLENEMAMHSSIFAWEIHGQRSLAGCSPWGCRRVRHDLVTK